MSEAYGEDARPASIAGFFLIAVPSVVVAVLLVLAVTYYRGSPARIASDYTALAVPANQALTAEVDAYASNQRHDLAAAKSDLIREVKTEAS
jgi:hypothetical protein